MNRTLYIQREIVALEAFVVTDVGALLKKVFPAVTEGLSAFVGRFNPTEAAINLSADRDYLVRELPKHSYLDVADLTAYKPAGLNVPLLEYVEVLEEATNHAAKTFHEKLPQFTLLLSRLINEDSFQMTTSSLDRDYVVMERTREKLLDQMGKCFKKGATDTQTTYGNLVSRNADWKDILGRTESMINTMNKVDRKLLNKKVEETVGLLSALADKINRNELTKASPQVVKAISEASYQLGSELEFFSAVYYRLMELSGTMNKTLEHFKNSTEG